MFFPFNAVRDVERFVELPDDKAEKFVALFDGLASVDYSPAFTRKISEEVGVDLGVARSLFVVADFFMTYSERSADVGDMISEIADFFGRGNPEIEGKLKERRDLIERLVGPTPARTRAAKVKSLQHAGQPRATNFRSICEVRPFFEEKDGQEIIAGYVPHLFLEIGTVKADGDEGNTIMIALSDKTLAELASVVDRTKQKLEAISGKFGTDLLGLEAT